MLSENNGKEDDFEQGKTIDRGKKTLKNSG